MMLHKEHTATKTQKGAETQSMGFHTSIMSDLREGDPPFRQTVAIAQRLAERRSRLAPRHRRDDADFIAVLESCVFAL